MADVVIAPAAPSHLVLTGGSGSLVLTSGETTALTVVAPQADAVAYDDAPAIVEVVPTQPAQIDISDHYVPVPGPQGERGPQGPQGAPGNAVEAISYVHAQDAATDMWVIDHPLPFVPAVTVVDSAGTQVHGDVRYDSPGRVVITFSSAFAGTAYLS
jgi:hypothetical protein